MSIKKTVEILQNTQTFGSFAPNVLNIIAFSGEKINFSTGDLLTTSNEKISQCIIIVQGRVFIQNEDRDNIEITEGSVIGERALLSDTVIKKSIIAGSKGQALLISKSLFDELAIQFPEMLEYFKNKIKNELNNNIEELKQFEKILKN
ncbi:cyclic nucleotide-binding domain-containing protein [Hyphomicrobiales bacterium]|jgi:signal-transduction protein with cAMP-binding, CBS, and nucleotidyltransferase domain|nr:Crp/Fnr family transcriptional regulator [Rhodobiaceae bacterium]MDB4831154.1 cyclic nucleotide-binding domain-containing protein [Hyphomicrobiales bacterium]MBT5640061.1 Crp/Fnr family transcriptional regulator [Rhodobiaceae bacterium]MBT6223106.1 Crp/Fnr family transcriptional regulator [Rhodobiaceae bacterium]MDC0139658.1 cyclic nucleotide-binding domain-containing protein [Hyphomicrobiales bacterium]|tara:strand:+ start:1393 stop:1836 length:444 start_codon:yes stop_codon:yes gene_type:complete